MERKVIFDQVIPPKSALAFVVKKGQYLRITDIEGKQVGDLVVFNEHDHSEKLCQPYTREHAVANQEWPKVRFVVQGITTGHSLISTIRNRMMIIVADTPVPGGIHDFLVGSCSSWVYSDMTGFGPRDGCLELLAKALEPYGIAKGNISHPMNVFMNVHYEASTGMLVIDEPVSRPGDYLELVAEMDCLVALTTCPDDVCSLCNGRPPHPAKPLNVKIMTE